MKVSICITVFNEEDNVSLLLDSLLKQKKTADEVIILDGGSTDNTYPILEEYAKKNKTIKVFQERSSRSKGRNIAIKKAKNEIIAITDAGCIANENWLENISKPFKRDDIDISAGFYDMKAEGPFEKAEAYFLGITPERFNDNFLPSARSMAFRKALWKKIGGFPDSNNSKIEGAEDTIFNTKALSAGAKYSRVKNARVEWRTPKTLTEFAKKLYNYAKWDSEYGIWWDPAKKFASHNMKVLLVYLRYLVGIFLLILSLNNQLYIYPLFIGVLLYSFWAFFKVFKSTKNFKAGVWGILLQFTADLSVMLGFCAGKL